MPTKWSKKWTGRVAILLAVVLAGALLAWWNPLEKQQLYLSNYLYYERPTEHQVVVVSIDGEAVSDDGLGKFSSWCRTNYIPVLEKLAEYRPAVIGIDILFLSKSEGLCKDALQSVLSAGDSAGELQKYADPAVHPDDLALGEALRELDNVVLAMRVAPADEKEGINLASNSLIQPPLAEISKNSMIGHNRFFQNANGLIGSLRPAFRTATQNLPSFPLEVVRLYLGYDENAKTEISQNKLLLSDNAGQKLIIPLEDGQMLINYSERLDYSTKRIQSGQIVIVPFMDLWTGAADYSTLLKDSIVLIGVRFDSSEDKYFTPVDPANKQYGVMIHAQAIQTILDQAWLRNLTLPEQIGVIVLLALLALAAVFLLPIWAALPLLALLVLGYEAGAAPLLFRWQGLILNMVYPPLTVILAAICGYAYRYLAEFRQKTRVAGALGQYVNAEVAQNVLESETAHVQTGGEKRPVTVIFTDIRGFTTISENLQAQSVVALLNEYFEAMTEVIVHNGGTVDKYEGDALMAFFEERRGLDGQAVRAAKAALEMRVALAKLNAKWKNDGPLPGGESRPEIDFRVGISSGEAVVGNIGSSRHLQYTVIGDIVNLGSRLESANKKYHTSVMLAEATYEAVKDHFECRFLDMIRVKGKERPVKVYELLAPRGELSGEQRDLVQAYNRALVKYFEKDFAGALDVFQKDVFPRWPADYLSNLYAGRCELLKRFPPRPDWDFVYRMESK